MVDTNGVLYTGRTEGTNSYKARLARQTELRTLTDALRDADVLVGLSAKGTVAPEMLTVMAPRPIVFALANPDPEISPEDARKTRKDVIIATGRSDAPNQVNNVLGFPFIFRGALDVRARAINVDMKLAVTHALAALAKVTDGATRNVLVVTTHDDELTWKSLRNVPAVHLLAEDQLNTYDVLLSDHVVFTEAALSAFVERGSE